MTILLSVFVIFSVVVVLGYPLWRPAAYLLGDPSGPAAQIRVLEERKLQIYAAIRDLGFDYRSDKLLEADYEDEVERLKGEAIAVVGQLDDLRHQAPRGPDALEAEIAAARAGGTSPGGAAPGVPKPVGGARGAVFCTQCGKQAADDDRFCAACGTALRSSP